MRTEQYDITPEPPTISREAFMRLARDWVDAMGGSFKGDESRGCEVRLRGKFTHTDSSLRLTKQARSRRPQC